MENPAMMLRDHCLIAAENLFVSFGFSFISHWFTVLLSFAIVFIRSGTVYRIHGSLHIKVLWWWFLIRFSVCDC